jgi:hypothetical protein
MVAQESVWHKHYGELAFCGDLDCAAYSLVYS